MKKIRKSRQKLTDELLIEICNLWFREKKGAVEIKKILDRKLEYELNREEIYSFLKEACDREFIRISPPEHNALSWELMGKYDGIIKVVSTGDRAITEGLAAKAAELVIDRIRDFGKKKSNKKDIPDKGKKIHLGLGAGITTSYVAREIATQYKNDSSLPDLEIHALTSGFESDKAHLSPISWFSWFMDDPRERVSFVGLFAPPMVPDENIYGIIRKLPGVVEAYDKAKDIQIVTTSLGNAEDSDGRWFPYVQEDRKDTLRKDHGWKGDVLYCPYSDSGPLPENALELQAVTLFKIPQLVSMAKERNKNMIVLVCGPSHTPRHRRKTEALRPLLENPELRVWTHLVTDVGTAHALLAS